MLPENSHIFFSFLEKKGELSALMLLKLKCYTAIQDYII